MKKRAKISKFMSQLFHYSPVSIALSPEGLMLIVALVKTGSHEF
jgi:hypothetical protein